MPTVRKLECQNVDSKSVFLDSTTLFPKLFLFGQGDTLDILLKCNSFEVDHRGRL